MNNTVDRGSKQVVCTGIWKVEATKLLQGGFYYTSSNKCQQLLAELEKYNCTRSDKNTH
jgi:hypothetical protein